MTRFALALIVAVAACDDATGTRPDAAAPDATPPDAIAAERTIVPGARAGVIVLGQTWAELVAQLGEPPAEPVVVVRIAHARWPDQGYEALLISADESTVSDDAEVIGAATTRAELVGPARPDQDRAAIEAALGVAPEAFGGRAYYPAGVAITYDADGRAALVAVMAPYALAPDPPPMTPTHAAPPTTPPGPSLPAAAGVIVDGRVLSVVDMHLHPGDYGAMAPTGKAFVTANLPPFLQVYAPALIDRLSDPWAPHVGIAAQTQLAGVGHAVLFAVYTHHTTGYFTNEALEAVLDDPRNLAADGRPWAWGMASLDLDDWDADVAADRLAALRSYLVRRHDRFIGIKLAHAHQGVALDDAAYDGIYDVAAEAGVPVLLHTGFSPFPGASDDPRLYDPQHLAQVVVEHDGDHGSPRVDFVLSHVGQGDARAVAHALDLAAEHPNVWLELSALARPLRIGDDGEPVTTTTPQYPAVLAAIRAAGLIDRTMFASDGPQYSGGIRSYLGRLVDGMIAAGYTTDEIAAVLAGNFERLYGVGE